MSGPQNAIVGDQELPTELPTTNVPDEILNEEKKLAKYSKTSEFKRLRKFMEDRIKFHQNFLPDGRSVKDVNLTEEMFAINWKAANIVITEFKNILAEYDRAAEVVSDAER